jgi:hypothetical protein
MSQTQLTRSCTSRERKLSWMTSVFLPRYLEPRKVPPNPCWCPYAKGNPCEGQALRSSNSVESHEPSPRVIGAPLPAPLGRSPSSPLSSFQPKRRRPRSFYYMVAAISQTRLTRSRKTFVPTWYNITSVEQFCGFF